MRVYPRVCGGTDSVADRIAGNAGLSPRVRGNQCRCFVHCAHVGSIPACAGEPFACNTRLSESRVYPRVCGGTLFLYCLASRSLGLSPRVRGNHQARLAINDCKWSIPACAGEPPSSEEPLPICTGLSPRVRGNLFGSILSVRAPRSIPACAGNPLPHSCTRHHRRSIPACAGEPRQVLSCQGRTEVYPRVCGGTERRVAPGGGRKGLSPRVRGNPSM